MTPGARELSARAVALGALLSAVLAASNAYLGLFAGMTVSAAIPASVLSMAIFRSFGGTLLENNAVQTAASAGEAAAAGAIFTLPALLILGAWSGFDYWTTTLLVLAGGVLGVIFTIPLKRALIVDAALPFPEGVATAAVLRAGHGVGAAKASVGPLLWGSLYGAVAKLCEGGLLLTASAVEGATRLGSHVLYLGSGLSPALAAVGSIVGLRVSLLVLGGGLVNWLVLVPLAIDDPSVPALTEAAWTAWSRQTRFVGVGAMTVGGLWTLITLRGHIARATRSALSSLGAKTTSSADVTRDLPPSVLGAGVLLCFGIVLGIVWILTQSLWLSAVMTLLIVVLGFLFSAVAAYMAGLVGSSNNPVSGVTIATILLCSTCLSLAQGLFDATSPLRTLGPAVAILLGSVICTAAAIGGDNMQDLKTGHLLGATPWKQQWAQLAGVVAAAFVMAPVLDLLATAYGFGAASPEHPTPLRAPQATLMASIATGVFGGSLPWNYVLLGAGLAAAVIAVDSWGEASGKLPRLPVLAAAVGLYLPLELTMPMALGALVTHDWRGKRAEAPGAVLVAAGLITGEALLGVVLAALVASVGANALSIGGGPKSALLGTLVFAGALWLLRGRRRGAAV